MSERALRDERGAIMLLGVFLAIFMTGILFYLSGIAAAVSLGGKLQDSVDAAVFGAAVLHARGMNLLVLLNQIMAALLAVLVGLRLVEMLATLGIATAAGLSFIAPAAALMIGPLQGARQAAVAAYQALDQPVHGALRALHATEVVVRDVIPGLAVASYSTLPEGGSRTVVAPARLSLPVESDQYSVLCERAGRDAGEVALLPLSALHLPDVLSGPIVDATGELAGSASDWFCGKEGSEAPKIERKLERVLPRMSARAACEDASSGTDPAATRRACADVERSEAASDPGLDGECLSDCGQHGAFEERVQKAREQCDPASTGGLHGFQWSERTVRLRRDENGRLIPIEHGPTRLVSQPKWSYAFPCGRAGAAYSETYERRVHASPSDPEVLPVCRSTPDPMGGLLGEFSVVEVLQIFQCVVTEKRTIDEGGKDGKAGNPDGEEPVRVEQGLTASSDDLQVRGLSAVTRTSTWIDRVVEASAWGNPAADVPPGVQELSGLEVAEAEYGFDGTGDPGEWMWSRSWTARLSRVRAPASATVTGALVVACGATGAEEPWNCASAAAAFGPLAGQVAH